MQISEYQQWVEDWDRQRGWHRVSPSHTLLHAIEELGEVARIVLQMEGYKESKSADSLTDSLGSELSDLFVFLFKLAYQCGVDVEASLEVGKAKANQRYGDLSIASSELDRYLARQAERLTQMTAGMTDTRDEDDTRA